jgi:hypothetical protein
VRSTEAERVTVLFLVFAALSFGAASIASFGGKGLVPDAVGAGVV